MLLLQAERLEIYIISDDTRHTSDFPVASALYKAHSVNTHNRVIRVGNRKFLFPPEKHSLPYSNIYCLAVTPEG